MVNRLTDQVFYIRENDDWVLKRTQDIFNENQKIKICNTWKYPLRGYFLGLPMHTTAWDQHCGQDETLEY